MFIFKPGQYFLICKLFADFKLFLKYWMLKFHKSTFSTNDCGYLPLADFYYKDCTYCLSRRPASYLKPSQQTERDWDKRKDNYTEFISVLHGLYFFCEGGRATI